jgi:putative restriction endonuclease
VLQELRDRDELTFLDRPGTYRLENLAYEPGDADSDAEDHEYEADTYETTVAARSLPTAFRDAVLSWYDHRCPVSGVDHEGLLDVAHVRSWSDHPDIRTDPGNVLVLDKTHHAAFDRGLFTIDDSHRLQVAPDFTTESDFLRKSLVECDGQQIRFPGSRRPAPKHLRRHNESLDWL